MIEFLSRGGVLVAPILLCSVLALAIFVERLIVFARLWRGAEGIDTRVAALVVQGDETRALETARASRPTRS